MKQKSTSLILQNIRSSHNVGAIFRTADAVGISKIYLTGYTPAPTDEFKRENKNITKTALGAEKNIVWEKKKNISQLLKKLEKDGCQIIALEQSEKSIDYKKIKITKPTVFILGNEVRGLSKSILDKCHEIAEIPMKGKKESLNVAVSAGVFLFRVLKI